MGAMGVEGHGGAIGGVGGPGGATWGRPGVIHGARRGGGAIRDWGHGGMGGVSVAERTCRRHGARSHGSMAAL